ncbi:hypothetical protein [Ornithinimicrobium faecis]|uniref:hypothetical protein n=1 Tax=Ornithinimicrobium faecis TaxID=2934158 RepID=UPI0021181B2A|nr:hypothetical protein [Ornithinimicrobium sp. HY1745]
MRWNLPTRLHWLGMIIFGVIFAALGVGAAVLAIAVMTETADRLAFAFVAVLCLVVGGIALFFAPRAKREMGTKLTDLRPAAPEQVATDPEKPWPLAAVASELAYALRETPYVVAHNDEVIQVNWDLQDRSWWVAAQKNGTTRAFETRLVMAGPGKVTRTDHYLALDWQAGVPVLGAATGSSSGGRVWRYEKRIELGTSREGVTKPVDYTFNTADLNEPLQVVLDRAGWIKPTLGAEAKGALIVGLIGASAIPLVPLAFLIKWWLDR